jgi:hypothetical protein
MIKRRRLSLLFALCIVAALALPAPATCKTVYAGGRGQGAVISLDIPTPPSIPTPPQVASTAPASGATNVPVRSAITAAFDVAMDASTINASTFTLSNGVVGNVSYDASTMTATFTPSAPLAYNTAYTATITTGVENSYGWGLGQACTWSFTTAAAAIITDIDLSPGCNLISLPAEPVNSATASVLYGMSGGPYELAWGYPNQIWQFYDPSNQGGSALRAMQAGAGYWIYMSYAGTLSVSGAVPPSSLPLSNGWNLVGYNGSTCTPASTALSSSSFSSVGALQVAWGYPNQSWQVYDPNDPAGSTLSELCPGAGYWLKVTGTPTWSGW